jgi:hypothetical protein
MIEHVFHLNRSNAWQREGRETILIEEINAVCFNRIYGRTAAKFAYEEDRVDMVWHWGMPMSILVLVVQCRQLFDDNVIAGFLFNFANGSDARGVTDIGPTTGYSPKAVLSLSHEQYPSSIKNRCAHTDFRSRISHFSLEDVQNRSGIPQARTCCHHFGGQTPYFLISLSVIGVFAVRKAILRESLKTPSQFKPVGTHNTILHEIVSTESVLSKTPGQVVISSGRNFPGVYSYPLSQFDPPESLSID